MQRFILLGLDGHNPEFVEKYIDELPNFRRMIAEGCWGPMLSAFPADTPTNWTALATGARASKSNITGFAWHRPGTSLKDRHFGPAAFPEFRNAEFFWEAAARQGKKSILINYPFGWHSKESDSYIIIGGDNITAGIPELGACGCFATPDRMDSLVDATVVATSKSPGSEEYECELDLRTTFRLQWGPDGPEKVRKDRNATDRQPGGDLRLKCRSDRKRIVIFSIEGNRLASLKKGRWSDYFSIACEGEKVWLRLFLADVNDDGGSFLLFHSPITRTEGWAKPADYAPLLTGRAGPYQQGVETLGALYANGWFGSEYPLEVYKRLLADCGTLFAGYGEILADEMPDWSCMFIQLHSTDGMNHRRLCHLDPECPLSDPKTAEETNRWFLECYKTADTILGQIAELAEKQGAFLVVVADHSAVPTHTWVDTARPFMEKDLLYFDGNGAWDESKSKVRKMINHSIYINLKGRQPAGIVEPGDYEKLRDEIICTLLSMRDPRTGDCPVAVAARREDLDSIGANSPSFGDVVYLMRPGYTNQPASEHELLTASRLGKFVADPEKGLREGYCFHRSIQGNHHDYMPNASYPGVCSNRAVLLFHGPGIAKGVKLQHAQTIDVAPTLAALLGIDPPAESEGKVLYEVIAQQRQR